MYDRNALRRNTSTYNGCDDAVARDAGRTCRLRSDRSRHMRECRLLTPDRQRHDSAHWRRQAKQPLGHDLLRHYGTLAISRKVRQWRICTPAAALLASGSHRCSRNNAFNADELSRSCSDSFSNFACTRRFAKRDAGLCIDRLNRPAGQHRHGRSHRHQRNQRSGRGRQAC